MSLKALQRKIRSYKHTESLKKETEHHKIPICQQRKYALTIRSYSSQSGIYIPISMAQWFLSKAPREAQDVTTSTKDLEIAILGHCSVTVLVVRIRDHRWLLITSHSGGPRRKPGQKTIFQM